MSVRVYELITIIDLKTDKKTVLRSGKYQLKLGDGAKDLELTTDASTLTRGDKEVVTIRKLPKRRMSPRRRLRPKPCGY